MLGDSRLAVAIAIYMLLGAVVALEGVPAPAQGHYNPSNHNQHQQDTPCHAPDDGCGHLPRTPPMFRRRGVGELWVRKRDGGDRVSVCASEVSRGCREAGEEKAQDRMSTPMFEQSWFQRFLAPHLLEVTAAAAL